MKNQAKAPRRQEIKLCGFATLREQKDLIRIVKEPDFNLYALSGKPISDDDFKNWIEFAENMPALSLNEAKLRWAD